MKDRVMLAVAYVLLVAVVVFGAWWLQAEAEKAQRARCEVANLEFGLATLTVAGLSQEQIDVQDGAVLDILEKAAEATVDICEGTGIEPSSITPGEEQ